MVVLQIDCGPSRGRECHGMTGGGGGGGGETCTDIYVCVNVCEDSVGVGGV